MNAQELFLKDGRSSEVFYCSQCKIVHRTQEQADKCCTPNRCPSCGVEVGRHWTICDGCRATRETEKERERFKNAEKVTTWDGWVYCECLGRDGFSESLQEMLDEIGSADEIPEYVWTCNARPFAVVHVSSILDDIAANGYEDFDPQTLDGIPELKEAIRIFNAANEKVLSYEPDYSTALLVNVAAAKAEMEDYAAKEINPL